ncbi:protein DETOXIFICATION 46, chloroplastic isoform X2 [Physcomitrium patens]|uniref:protein DETOXIFICATION 46, chloroplastic isoform X2 n=1 Tax=Physcomitrium patens TaxID=3218 RepID=UPI003CCD4500
MLKSLNDKGYNTLAINTPSFKQIIFIINLAAPIALTMVSNILFYTIISFLATSLGPVTLAAHQVMMGLYILCTTWGEPLAQTAQCFMPAHICGVDRNLQKARDLLKSLMKIGIIVGFFPQIFTKDLGIIAQMRLVSVPFLFSLMITPPTLSLEGTLLAVRDLHARMLAASVCKDASHFGLQGSWWMLAAFQWTRFFQAYSRLHSSRSVLANPPLSHDEGSLLQVA